MRTFSIVLLLSLGMGLVSCTRDDHESPDARQAGRNAYRAAQDAKRDLKQAEHDIEKAGKEFREGWNEAKHNDKSHPDRDRDTNR